MIPVINLPRFCDVANESEPGILIITEYNKNIQGFLVHSVDSIKRLAWEAVKVPPAMLAQRHGGLVTAVTELNDGRLVMIMDVEMVLSKTAGFGDDPELYAEITPLGDDDFTVLFADDSSVARSQIVQTLDAMGINHISCNNGADAWQRLTELLGQAEKIGRPITDFVQCILTDVEMPEMDGYVLTKKIKENPRFDGIPVIMHSSLSTGANQELGKGVGADAYVPKFEPRELAAKLREFMAARNKPEN
jgi:two-component system chemotaxis response regulator CheV